MFGAARAMTRTRSQALPSRDKSRPQVNFAPGSNACKQPLEPSAKKRYSPMPLYEYPAVKYKSGEAAQTLEIRYMLNET